MIQGKTITVVIPTKNEAKGIQATIARIPKSVDQILVVDGSSKDGTPELAKKLGAKVIDEPKKGYGQAYLTAFKNISTDLVLTIDGDGTYPVERIEQMVTELETRKLDFLNGSRFPLADLNSMYFKNFWGNMAITFAFNTLFGSTLTDSLSGMWLFRSQILQKMKLESVNWNFSEEIKYEAIRQGFRFGEMQIPYRERLGETKMSPIKTGIENLLYLLKLRLVRGTLKNQIEQLRLVSRAENPAS